MELSIPNFPALQDPSFAIDPVQLQAEANSYCADPGAGDPAAGFFLGELPIGAFDTLCSVPPERQWVGPLLGLLHLSGYFGGIWLKGALSASGGGLGWEGVGQEVPADGSASRAVEILAEDRLAAALSPIESSLSAASREVVPALLAIYGYNLGYLRTLIEHSPAGMQLPTGVLECDSFLGCTSTAVRLDILEKNRALILNLSAPPSEPWREWAETVSRIEESTTGSGRSVWEGILSGSVVRPDAYGPLLALSAGYLMASEAAVLINMDAWASVDPGKSRCGLLLDAGLEVWSASYFLGLVSPAPEGTFPRLRCP
ncbi:MAG: hypothetical protein HYT87_18250 [Nitrospirae bacterium]|nr:hypothetical protein [Nitrospirota bacterium]